MFQTPENHRTPWQSLVHDTCTSAIHEAMTSQIMKKPFEAKRGQLRSNLGELHRDPYGVLRQSKFPVFPNPGRGHFEKVVYFCNPALMLPLFLIPVSCHDDYTQHPYYLCLGLLRLVYSTYWLTVNMDVDFSACRQ